MKYLGGCVLLFSVSADRRRRPAATVGTNGRLESPRWHRNNGNVPPANGNTEIDENKLLQRITANPGIFGGKPIVRGRRLAVEHVLGMLAAGELAEFILSGYPWLEPEDIQACLVYARRMVGHERIEPPLAMGGDQE